jgi:hypothetical protein
MAFKLLKKSATLGILLAIDGERTPFSTIQVAGYAPSSQAGFVLWGQHAVTGALHLLDGFRMSVKSDFETPLYDWCREYEIEKIIIAALDLPLQSQVARFHPVQARIQAAGALSNYPSKIVPLSAVDGQAKLHQFEAMGLLDASQYRGWPRCQEFLSRGEGEMDVEAGAVLLAAQQARRLGQARPVVGSRSIVGFS